LKYRIILIICLLFLYVSESFSQSVSNIMYVNSLEGLNVRESASISGKKIGLLPNLAQIYIIEEEKDFVSIDNIEGKWVLMTWYNFLEKKHDYLKGWVFNGYLMNSCDYVEYLKNIDFEQILPIDDVMKNFEYSLWFLNSMGHGYFFDISEDIHHLNVYRDILRESSYQPIGFWHVVDNRIFLSEIGYYDMSELPNLYKHPNESVIEFVFLNNDVLVTSDMADKPNIKVYFRGKR